MMNNTELLPCPFCGNTEPKLVPKGSAPEAFVYCGKCDLTANLTETAIKKWNTRADKALPVGVPMCSREIEECDPIAPARGIFNGVILGIIAWLAIFFIMTVVTLAYWYGVEAGVL